MMFLDFSHKTHQKPPFIDEVSMLSKSGAPSPRSLPGMLPRNPGNTSRSEPGGCLAQGWWGEIHGKSMENPCAFHIGTSSEHHLLDAWKCEIPFLIENFRWPKGTCWRTFANGPMTSVLETWEPAHRQLSESTAEWSCQRLPGPNRKRPERRKVFMLCFMAFSGCFMLFPLPCPVNEGWSNRKRRGATKRFWSPLVSKKSFKNRNSEVAVSSHKAGN